MCLLCGKVKKYYILHIAFVCSHGFLSMQQLNVQLEEENFAKNVLFFMFVCARAFV